MSLIFLFFSALAVDPAVLPGAQLFLKGDAALNAGELDAASATFKECASADAFLAPYARLREAAVRMRRPDKAGAMAVYRGLLEKEEDGPWKRLARCRLAALVTESGDREEARELYAHAVNVEPLPWFLESDAWAAADNLATDPNTRLAAIPFYRDIVEKTIMIEQRKRAGRALLEIPEAESRALGVLGLLRSGQMDDVRKIMQTEPVMFKEPSGEVSMQVLDALVATFATLPPEAPERFRDIARLNADNPWMRSWLLYAVRVSAAKKNWDVARLFCDLIVQQYADRRDAGDALYWLAGVMRENKNIGGASELYRRLGEKFGSHTRAADAWFALGDMAKQEQRWTDALSAYAELGKRCPAHRLAAEGCCESAKINRHLGNLEGEARCLVQATKSGTGNFFAHRAQYVLHVTEKNTRALNVSPGKPYLGLFEKDALKPLPESPEIAADPGLARLRFFGANGLEEGDWEALDCILRAPDGPSREAWYRDIAEAGFMHMAVQFARSEQESLKVKTININRLEYPLAYWPQVKSIAAANGVDPYLVLAVSRQESTFRAGIVSRSGAVGLMQLMPGTAKGLAKKDSQVLPEDASNLKSPTSSIRMGAAYLRQMIERNGGNLVYTLASYNAGPGNCDKWRNSFSTDDMDAFIESITFAETKDYVKRVLGNYAAYHTLYPVTQK